MKLRRSRVRGYEGPRYPQAAGGPPDRFPAVATSPCGKFRICIRQWPPLAPGAGRGLRMLGEVLNVARAPGKTVKLAREGRFDNPAKGLVDLNPKERFRLVLRPRKTI